MNELTEEPSSSDGWWNEEHGWQSWNDAQHEDYQPEGESSPKEQEEEGHVGSLILSMVLNEPFDFSSEQDVFDECLQLEEKEAHEHADGSIHSCPQPFLHEVCSESLERGHNQEFGDEDRGVDVAHEHACIGPQPFLEWQASCGGAAFRFGSKSHSDLKEVSDDDASRDLCSDLGVKFNYVIISDACVNKFDECSPRFSLSKFGWVMPLLTELSVSEDPTWWLLDSGASICVLADTFEQVYNFQRSGDSTGGFRAANGSSVNMSASGVVTVGLDVEKDKKSQEEDQDER